MRTEIPGPRSQAPGPGMPRRRSPDAGLRLPRRRVWNVTAAVLCAAVIAGCGRKGPPLAPFVRTPAAVQTIDARRVGSDVYVTLTVPAENIDASTPAAVSRVEVYGATGVTPPTSGRFLEGATVVATIDVAPAAAPGEPVPEVTAGVTPGVPVTVRDRLSPGELVEPPAPAAPGSASAGGPPRRFYMAIAFNDRGVPGPPGAVIGVRLATPPDPPTDLTVSYTADAVTLSWQASGGLMAFLLDRALPVEPSPAAVRAAPAEAPAVAAPTRPPGPTLYNVYRDIAPDPLARPAPADEAPRERVPLPLNPAPLDRLTFTEPVSLDERERCYLVRTVRGVAPETVEGDPSPRACVTPLDVFAPARPAGLVPVASANAISLIWQPNTEADLAGYLVLRGEAGGDTLAPLTREPVQEAQFTDDTVTPGVRYVYEVVAVDARLPLPNASAPARVEETAR